VALESALSHELAGATSEPRTHSLHLRSGVRPLAQGASKPVNQ
jgi:hypothetical protein